MLHLWLLLASAASAAGLVAPALAAVSLPKATTGETVSLEAALAAPGLNLLVFGTYPADFNMIEYAQRLTHYLPALQSNGVSRVLCVVNGSPKSCELLAERALNPPHPSRPERCSLPVG